MTQPLLMNMGHEDRELCDHGRYLQSDLEVLLRELVAGVARDEGEGGFALWADIDGYEWLARVEKTLAGLTRN